MAIVTEISWDDMLDGKPLPENPARQAWREAVAEIADKAKAKLPECSGRVESAVKIVLAGDVELQADGTAKVASQSTAARRTMSSTAIATVKTSPRRHISFCKHRLSAAIARRAQELTKAKLNVPANSQAEPPRQPAPAQPDTPTVPLPEAPVRSP